MRILHGVLTDDFYGSEHYCAQIARLQGQAGDEVAVVVRGACPEPLQRFRAIVGPGRVIAIPAWAPAFLERYFVARAVRDFRPDVVHTHLGRATRLLGRIARRRGILHVASLHLRFNPKTYAACDAVVCVAAWQRETIRNFRGHVGVVRNWVPELRRKGLEATFPPDFGEDSDGRRVITLGSVGRLEEPKGYDLLVEAFRLAFPAPAQGSESRNVEPSPGADRVPASALRLVIVGEGPERARLEQLAAGDPRIRLVGYQTDVAAWLDGFDAFVSSSRFEGLALVLLEAMKLGVPMLLTGIAGNAELADLQDAARAEGRRAPRIPLVEAENAQALAEGLRTLVADLAGAGRTRVAYDLSELDKDTAAARMAVCYEEALRLRNGRGKTARKGRGAQS